ncbi:hypothetical protein P7C73_g502, partial [Tremellales sp. Uapishka_1]
MLSHDEIIRTALREHDGDLPENVDVYASTISEALKDVSTIPPYSRSSKPLSIVSFRCLLQDTGYPMEVYLPASIPAPETDDAPVDWSKLQERWVGWGVEIPGEQSWSNDKQANGTLPQLDRLSITSARSSLHPAVHSKYPLPGKAGDYLGALVKVYDDLSYRPASTFTFIGIVSTAALPSPISTTSDTEEEPILVPTIHVLCSPLPAYPPSLSPDPSPVHPDTRSSLLSHLAQSFSPPDAVAAEYLLLLLLSSPTSRPISLQPLGTLSINFLTPPGASSTNLEPTLSTLTPLLLSIPLTLPLLHSHPFFPSSSASNTSLTAGLLQLAPGTTIVIQEDGLGEGGQLNETAIKNLKALSEVLTDQTIRYDYPFMEGLKMECDIRVAVVSEGKSLLPVDVYLPLHSSFPSSSSSTSTQPSAQDLVAYRAYLAEYSSSRHAAKLHIPDTVADLIQDDFVESRKGSTNTKIDEAESTLKRRMRIARLLALSHDDAVLSPEVWKRCILLDQDVEKRLEVREQVRRESKLGQPAK